MEYYTEYPSPLGMLTIASDGTSCTGLWMEGQKYHRGTLTADAVPRDGLAVFTQIRDWLDRYFSGERPDIRELPLRPAGSRFRRVVWECLCQIPYGTVATYGEIGKQVAVRLGKARMSAQAVGGAVGHNPISIIIPCHRVVGADGGLTGYAGGVDRKLQLLRLEGADR